MYIMKSNPIEFSRLLQQYYKKNITPNKKFLILKKNIMLQRIQSIFILCYVITILGCFLIFPISFKIESEQIQWGISNLPYLFILLAGYNIFLFSRRKIQITMNIILLFFSIGYEILVFNEIYEQIDTQLQFIVLRFLLALTSWLMLIFANKYIRKDEALIKSMDRLR